MAVDDTAFGFSFQVRKTGDVVITHHGRIATTLRGRLAEDFRSDAAGADPEDLQALMARLTGNYKRGNERLAGRHPRNQG